MSHDPKLFPQQQPPQQQPNYTAPLSATNIFIGNDPPAYQEDKHQQRKVPNPLELRENNQNVSFLKFWVDL
jgi:hypothetical protein